MKLNRWTERVWYYPMEEERDRPNLGYIRGDRWSVAVDAGHSDVHVAEFYRALEEASLPLPKLTVLTHWHWDHTFAMHAITGLSLANANTNRHLREVRDRLALEGPEAFLSMDETVRREYADGRPMVIVPADLEYTGEILLDAGNCPIRVFQVPSPHTDDATLVEAVNDKALFLGDASCGAFPTWEKDRALSVRLAEAIRASGAECCLEGHWVPCSKQDSIDDLLNG